MGLAGACTKGAKEGEEEARREAERLQKEKEATGGVAKVVRPPVPGMAKIPCTQLLDIEKFGTSIGEKEPVTMKDLSKSEADAASSCSIHRGGKRLTQKEQEALLKKEGRLGVLAGDELCNVTAYCYTIEEAEKFKTKCKARKDRDDESMGTYACMQVVAQGVDDVYVCRFFDEDTKCILQVRGGPSNVDNEIIRNCAKAARDQIGPAQIAVTPGNAGEAKPAEASPDGSAAAGAGSGG
ncbi:MAG TPA: hypothetical protein VK427_05690 [Kofleriaceae bacterium]|nr:hypothetical protein [Kofleriaceae bacterium]